MNKENTDQLREQLAKAEARLRAVIEAADEAVACIDCADLGGARQILIRTIRAARSGDLPKPDRKHVCAFSRAMNGECFVCGSVDEKIAQAQAEADARHAKSGDLPPHPDSYTLGWNAAIARAHEELQRAALNCGWDTSGEGYYCDQLVSALHITARAQAEKEAQP